MKHVPIDKAALKAKSEELAVPFSNLLAGCVLEEFMYLLSDSSFAEVLWLKNSAVFGIEQYRRKNIQRLEFAYLLEEDPVKKKKMLPGQALSLKIAYIMLADILKKEKTPEIKWRGRASFDGEEAELELTGELEEMVVPLWIKLYPVSERELLPVRKKLALFMEQDQEITYLQYPWERSLAEQFCLILKDLELIPKMQAYDDIYRILTNETIDGRHVRELFAKICGREQLELNEDLAEELLSYKNYGYMKKRWEKYLRHKKSEEPSWEQIMDVIGQFLPRVWAAICKDEVFFGDWMPALKRFLD